eukprot:CAMPEP_0196828644 /NCGR_PEP_ID=MMETSP1362-20130617/94784_1 /TAXON_ID=163516 /ORGANISM="Leptocylindrus danicus, Strain CCMP1856" /LENGTH=692 /DNA_ID=CAMNT_0042209327 /DNA_START=381 /DNA_END=2459 /DNA_ORIENTATION=+
MKSAPFWVAISPTPSTSPINAIEVDFVRKQTEQHLNTLLGDMKYQTSIDGFISLSLELLVNPPDREYDWTGFQRQLKDTDDSSSSNVYFRGQQQRRANVVWATVMEYRASIVLEDPDPELDINDEIARAMALQQSVLVDMITSEPDVFDNLKNVDAAEFQYKLTAPPSFSPSVSPSVAPIPRPSPSPVIGSSLSPSAGPSLVTATETSNMLWIIIAAAGGTVLIAGLVFLVWRRRRRDQALKTKTIQSPPLKSSSSDDDVNGTFPFFAGHTHGHTTAPVAPPILTVDSSPLTEDEFEKDWDPNLPFEWGPTQDIDKPVEDSEEDEVLSFTDLPKKDEELDKLAEEAKALSKEQNGAMLDDESDFDSDDEDDEEFPMVHGEFSEQAHNINVDDDATPGNTIEKDEVDSSDLAVRGNERFPTTSSQSEHEISKKGSFPQISNSKSDGAFPVLTDTADGSFPVKSSPPRASMQHASQSATTVGGADVSVSWSKEETLSYMHPMDWSNNSYGESLIYGDDALSRGMQSKFTHGSVTTGGSSGNNKLIRDLMWLEKKIADHRKANSGGHITETNPDLSLATIPQEHSNDTEEGHNFHSMSMKSVFIRDIQLEPGELPFSITSTRDGPAVHTITNLGLMNDCKLAEGDLIISVDQLDTRNMVAEQLYHFMKQKEKYYNITVLHFEENKNFEQNGRSDS